MREFMAEVAENRTATPGWCGEALFVDTPDAESVIRPTDCFYHLQANLCSELLHRTRGATRTSWVGI